MVKDGDALKLAVQLGMSVNVGEKSIWVHPDENSVAESGTVFEMRGTDPLAATCLAITRAAAEIGRTME